MVFKSTDWGNFLVPFGGKQNFSLDDSFTVQLQKDIQGLTDFQTAINNGNVSLEEAKKCLKECSQGAIIYSDRIANGTGNVDDFRQQSIMAQVALNAQNKSLGNCAALIGEYNTAIGTSNNMTANAGVSQQSFATAVSQSNPALGTYLSNLNGSKASLGGYVISLIAAKASTIALQVATMALNTALTMGISFAISTLISAIRDWIDENHTSKEELEEIIDTFQRQRSEVNKNAKELDELIPKYEKLSKGVNSLGENVSLTSDEYEEYHEVTNKIADFVPSLVQGFDEQGNAILSCKDNVDELTEAYNNLIRSQNSAVLAEGKSVFKDFTKQRKDFEKSNYQNTKMTVYANEALRNILKSNNFDEAIRQYAPAGTTQFVQIVNALKDAGLEQNTLELGEDFIKRSIQENKVIVESIVDNYDSQIKEAIEGMETVTSAYISNAFIGTYKNISPGLQTLITSITSSFGYDFYAQFDKVSDLYSYLDKLMSDFNKLDKDSQEKLALVFDLETQYNNKEISLEEYQAGIKAAKEVYEKLDTETQKNFALIFDFDTVLTETENVKELTDEQKAKIANAFKQSAGLDDGVEVPVDLKFNPDDTDFDDSRKKFNEYSEWFGSLIPEEQVFVYNISVEAENTQLWTLEKWKKELDLIKESGMSSAESLKEFNKIMGDTADDGLPKYIKTYRENIELLNDALFKLNTGTEFSKSDRLSLLEKFPSLSGAINNTSALAKAISELINETNTGLDDKFAESIEAVGGVATESGKALLEYQNLLKSTEETTFDFDIEKETEKFSAMYSAISESVSGTGVSQKSIDTLKEMFSGLGGYKTADLFEKTAHGIHLNAEELRKLQKEYENTKKKEFADQIENLKQKYNDCTAAIDGLVEGSDLYNQKVAERDAILTEIENVEMLSAQYDGLTSAYNKWIKAKSAGNERDMYENMLSEVDTVQDLIDRGWAGSEEVRNYIELLGGKDLTTATVNEIIAEWDRLNEHIGNSGFTAFDFFTKDEDGKTVSDGIYNFFNTVRTVMGEEFAKLNGDGTWTFNFTNTKDIAEQLGLGVEYVETILRAASDAGFNINFNVQNTKAIDEANEKIEKTEATVKELKAEPIKVDVDTEDAVTEINRVKAEIDKVQNNSEITTEVKAAITEDADAKLDLIAEKKVQLEQPTFMTISVDVLEDESLSDTLELLHNYQTAVNDVDKLKLLDESDDKVAEAQKKVDEYAKQISELSPEIKAKIGIDEKATVDDIKKKIEKNEIKIKTKLDIDEDLSLEDAIKRIEKSISGLSGSFAEELKKSLSDVLSDKDIKINADVSGISLVEKLYNAINELQGKTVSVKAKVTGRNLVDKLYSAIERLESKVVDVSASVTGTQDVNNLRNAIQELTDKTVTVTTILNEISGSGQVDGTAHANGTAYANGNWGAKDSGVALGGELGREIVVRDGKWFTVGDNGAEFFSYKKNDIIFNADQASQLLENGKITHGKKRGKSFAEGTAFYGGTGASGGGGYTRKVKTTANETETTTPTVDTNPSGSGFYDTPSSSNSSGDSEKFIDRIAIKINRLQREISKLSSAVSNIFTLWSDRGKSLSSEIGKITEEIDVQERAAVRYLEEANKQISKYGLKQDWIEDIQNGGVAFSYLTNRDDLYEGYQAYQQWYEKYLEARDSVADLKKDLSQLYQDNFDNIQKDFENQLALNQSVKDENEKDFTATTDYFSEMRKIESKNLDILNDELSGLESSLEKAVNSGAIQEGSEAWQKMKVAIDDVNRSISKTNVELAKLHQEHFSYIQESYGNQIESYKSLRNENEKTYKKDTNYFSEMRGIQRKNIASLENELEDLEAVYDEAMDSGRIEMYSDAWYEMRKGIDDTKRAISDANVELAKLYQDEFNYIQQNYQNELSLYEYYSNIYSSKATLLQTQGYMASRKLLSMQQDIQKRNISTMNEELVALEEQLTRAMDAGEIEQYSSAWYDMTSSINAVKEAIYNARIEQEKLNKAMRQLDWDEFDFKQETTSQLTDESDFLINMMSYTDLYDKKGRLTDTGLATMGLHNLNADVHQKRLQNYLLETTSIDLQLYDDPNNIDLIKRKQELIKLQRESAIARENEQKAIVSMVENGIKLELDSLKELIDTYKEALDSAKDLYDYQNSIADKSKKITDIQKQLTAYTNDSSEETKATVQKLQVDLLSAQKDLRDTEYTRSISDQKKLLDEVYSEYESFLNTRLDDTNRILEDMRMVTNAIPGRIGEVLRDTSWSASIHISDEMNSIWNKADDELKKWNENAEAQQQINRDTLNAADASWGSFGDALRGSVVDKYSETNENINGVGDKADNIKTAVDMNAHGIATVFSDLEHQSGQIVANADKNADNIKDEIYKRDNNTTIQNGFTTTNDVLKGIDKHVEEIREEAEREAAFYMGDVDMDGKVTPADSLKILRTSLGFEKLDDVQMKFADVDGDGKITSADSIEVLRRSLGLSKNVKSYSTGGLVDYTGIANIHGTKDKPELVLNANDTQNFMSLRDTLRNIAAKQDLSIIGSGYNVAPSTFAGLAKVSTFASGMSSPNVTQNTTVNLGGIAIDHVEDYNDLISQMQKDKNFEKLIRAMTIDQMTGKGSLTKYEHRW